MQVTGGRVGLLQVQGLWKKTLRQVITSGLVGIRGQGVELGAGGVAVHRLQHVAVDREGSGAHHPGQHDHEGPVCLRQVRIDLRGNPFRRWATPYCL